MDPITVLFSAYLDIVNTTVSDHYGTEIQAVMLEYNEQTIPFQYQFWKIKSNSVCEPYKSTIKNYSLCTIEAKKLFADLCTSLNEKKSSNTNNIKHRDMYCNAAVSYKPTVALISAGEEEDELAIAKQKCNTATIAALDSEDGSLKRERKHLCDKYNALREN